MMHTYRYSFFPLGDSAVLVDFGNVMDEHINQLVLQLFYTLQNHPLPGLVEVVPAYSSVAVFYDVMAVIKNAEAEQTAFDVITDYLKAQLHTLEKKPQSPRHLKVPVCYSCKYAWDLEEMANLKKMTVDAIIERHTSKTYRVYMIGFLPGFAYMGEVEDDIAVARKSTPRTAVPAGSVGIAGKQTGIYPLDAPGGWQIIGRTPLSLFNKQGEDPVLFRPGDEVSFYSITEHEFEHYKGRHF